MSLAARHIKAPFQEAAVDYLSHSFQTEDHFERLLLTLMTPPLFTTIRIPKDSEDNDEARVLLSEKLSEQCENMDWSPFKMFLHPALKDCVVIENRGPNRLEKHAKEIIVDVHCGMAVLRGAHVFKQGILGAPHGLNIGDHVSVYADLLGRCLKGLATQYPGDKVLVGNGVAKVTRSDLFTSNAAQSQSGIGILMTNPLYQAPSLSDLSPVVLFPQNLPSIVCSHALDPQPGQIVLDFCAAPGGKTTHIASLMHNKGRLVALEKSAGRVAKMKERLGKTNFSIIEIFTFDSTKAVDPDAVLEGGPPYPPASFDSIMVDAPCSALGQRPCLMNNIAINQLKSFPLVQHRLLSAAVQLLKPGGILVYSTCTLPVEENEDQVHRLLKKYPCLRLMEIPFATGSEGLASSQLDATERTLVKRFDPSLQIDPDSSVNPWDRDTIGFFIAKFQKSGDDCAS